MHQKIEFDDYKQYPEHLQKELYLLDMEYFCIEKTQLAGKLPEIHIPEYPLGLGLYIDLLKDQKKA